MSDPYVADRSHNLGYVSHNNKTTWSKSKFIQPYDKKRTAYNIIAAVILALIIILIGMTCFSCAQTSEVDEDISHPSSQTTQSSESSQ